MSQVSLRALAVAAVFVLGPVVIAQQTPAPVPYVTVTGEVNHPGPVTWTPGLSVQDAINAAGGLTDRAVQTPLVQRTAGSVTSNFTVQTWRVLEPGDTLEIARRPFAGAGPRVFVTGAVARPGDYTLASSANAVAAAIAAAGGLTAQAGDDIQVWMRPGAPRMDHPPIDASTKADDVTIRHLSRVALDSSAPAGLFSDGQAIVVPNRGDTAYAGGTVTVSGDVHKPSSVRADRLSLRSALISAGGLTSIAPMESVAIIHVRPDGSPVIGSGRETISYQDIADGSLDLPLRDGDVVTVPSSSFSGGGFETDIAPGGAHVVEWFVGRPIGGATPDHYAAGATAQEALTARNGQRRWPEGAPEAPLLVSDMTIERAVKDRLELVHPKPTFVLEAGDEVTVIRRQSDAAPPPPNVTALIGNWIIDRSRRLTLQLQHGKLAGTIEDDAGVRELAAESFGVSVALREVPPRSKRVTSPTSPLSTIHIISLGPGNGLVGRTDTIHAGVEGLRYFTRDSWRARR